MGYAIKLIGHTTRVDGQILAMVSPRLVPVSNPLSGINDVFNGILVDANMVGKVMFYGPGAGKLPTASAVVADIIDILSGRADERRLPHWTAAQESEIADAGAFVARRCYLIEGCPRCAEKAKKALDTEICEFVEDGAFAVISRPMTAAEADAALAAVGLQAKISLPVLD